ncbi:MAG: DNA polymerase III subunit delta' [Clostridium sp.]
MEEFIGFNKIISKFIQRVKSGKLSHAHLIAGEDGIGKSKIAKIFALQILNKTVDRDYIDIISYKASKASFGVDEVRNIIEEVSKKPFESDKKVIIIHDADKLTHQAQNALLKTIEEPPQGVYIIILSNNLESILETIKSRCQIYKLTPLSKSEIREYVEHKHSGCELLNAAIAYSEGIPGRVDKFLLDEELKRVRGLAVNLLIDINEIGEDIIAKYEPLIVKYKGDKIELLNILVSFIRDIIVYKEIENADRIINNDRIDDIGKLANLMSYKKLNSILKNIEEARGNIINNSNYSTSISIMLMGFLEG